MTHCEGFRCFALRRSRMHLLPLRLVWLAAITLSLPLAAHADLLEACSSTASQINRTTPQQIDKYTTLLNAVCVPSGREVMLIYRNEVNVPAGTLDQNLLNSSLKPKMLQAWCTDPVQRRTLNLINIRYTYNDTGGRFVGKVDISRNECK